MACAHINSIEPETRHSYKPARTGRLVMAGHEDRPEGVAQVCADHDLQRERSR